MLTNNVDLNFGLKLFTIQSKIVRKEKLIFKVEKCDGAICIHEAADC